MDMIRIAVVEDVDEYRNALALILNNTPGLHCEQCFANAESAIRELPRIKPDVVLTDINLPGKSGIEVIIELKNRFPAMQFMMLTVYEDDDKIFHALEAGATGYLLKSTPPAKIVEAVRELYEGGSPMSAQIARKVVDRLHHIKPESNENPYETLLSEREKEVLDLLRTGLLYKQIADRLHISEYTVKTHCRHIYEKLHVTTRGEAVHAYFDRKK
ncbi:MAG: response regulator transcription factor [Thermoanaerobaculia bacterium]|nr:response regulator transcription factor [Thermoanaerobaculia bacterium]